MSTANEAEAQLDPPVGLPEGHPGHGLLLGPLIDMLTDTREQRRVIAEEDKRLGTLFAELETEIQRQMHMQGMDMARGTRGSVTLGSKLVPAVENWDLLNAYILDNSALHLLERRVASNAYREMQKAGIELPGVVPFAKATLNLRST